MMVPSLRNAMIRIMNGGKLNLYANEADNDTDREGASVD